MEDKLLLSIIVPVYNAADSLKKSVGSVFRQGLDSGTFEVLLVNDGSNDDSLNVCKSLASEHSEIRVINKENGGVSSARNCGIKESKGEWIAFLDADDYLLDNGYSVAFKPYASRTDVDLIHYFSDYDFWPIRTIESGKRFEGKAWDLMSDNKEALPSFCWLYFYRKSFLSKNGLLFQNYIVGEDQLFSSSAYLANPYMITVKANIYRYVVHDDSATTRRTIQHARRAVKDYVSSYADILTIAHKYGADKEYIMWKRCQNVLDSKKVFAVSRMLSARYTHKEWKNLSDFCHEVHFSPILEFSSGTKHKISIYIMNSIMNCWLSYSVFALLFNIIVEPFVLPKLRVASKSK